MMDQRVTRKQWRRRARRAKVERHYTIWWRLFRLLRWLKMKDAAYSIFRSMPAYDVYVNGEHFRTYHIKRKEIVVAVKGTPRVPLASEIKDPPPVTP